MLSRYRFARKPGWIVFHLFVLAAAVTMVLLGRWQLDVSNSKHFSLQNFGYAIQWWLFTVFAFILWWRVMRDAAQRDATSASGVAGSTPAEPAQSADNKVAYRRYVMPTAPQPTTDPALAAYNDYLARLAAKDAEDAQ